MFALFIFSVYIYSVPSDREKDWIETRTPEWSSYLQKALEYEENYHVSLNMITRTFHIYAITLIKGIDNMFEKHTYCYKSCNCLERLNNVHSGSLAFRKWSKKKGRVEEKNEHDRKKKRIKNSAQALGFPLWCISLTVTNLTGLSTATMLS